jgi:hypothetical protein
MTLEYKIPELPILKDDGLPPKVYYRLEEPAEMLHTTSDALIHYGATARLELVTPVPAKFHIFSGNMLTDETDYALFDKPYLVALRLQEIREIELFGKTLAGSFSSGYEIWGGSLIPLDPFDPPQDEDGLPIKQNPHPIWEYRLFEKSVDELSGIEVTPQLIFIVAPELERFKKGGASYPVDPVRERNLTVKSSNQNRSDKLAALNQAFWKFWANANQKERSTHPDNTDVAGWLENRGYSSSMAKKAASIIRPEWAPTGRKPEE